MSTFFNFQDNGTIDSLDPVPEQYRGLYIEGQGDHVGKHVLMDNPAVRSLTDAYVGTHKSLEQVRADKKSVSDENAERRLSSSAYEGLLEIHGLDEENRNPDGLKTFITDLLDKIKGGDELKINVEKINQAADKRVQEAKDASSKELEGMRGTLEKFLVGDVAKGAIAEAKGSIDLLLPLVKEKCKVIRDGEEYVVRVLDTQGDARADGAGGWMTVAGLIAEMKNTESLARAFESETKGGSDSKPGTMNTGKPGEKAAELSPVQKIAQGIGKGQFIGAGNRHAG